MRLVVRAPIARLYHRVMQHSGKKIPTGLTTLVVVGVLIGVSYALSAINQVLFDNRLRKNFDLFECKEDKELRSLRELAAQRLVSNDLVYGTAGNPSFEMTDYLLYEILGGIDEIDTRPFVNDAKAYGIFFSSVVAAASGTFVVRLCGLIKNHGNLQPSQICFIIIFLVILLGITRAACCAGRKTVKAQYRARAIRLYVNFLSMPLGRIHEILRHGKPLQKPDTGRVAKQ